MDQQFHHQQALQRREHRLALEGRRLAVGEGQARMLEMVEVAAALLQAKSAVEADLAARARDVQESLEAQEAMRAQNALLHAQVLELEQEGPKAGEVRVKVKAAGVCMSDYHIMIGDWPLPLPMIVLLAITWFLC